MSAARPLNVTFLDPTRQTKQAKPPPPREPMAPQEIQEYIRNAPAKFLACRESRHRYPDVPVTEMTFRRTPAGLDVYTVDCTGCGAAYREETWLIKDDRGVVTHMEFIGAITKYHRDTDSEQSYLLPTGHGFLRPRDLHETRISQHLVGRKIRREPDRRAR